MDDFLRWLLVLFGAITVLVMQQDALMSNPPTSAPETAQVVAFDQALYDRGVDLYLANYCGTCHQLNVAETIGNFGPSHNAAAAHAADYIALESYQGTATTVEGYIRESIVEPRAFFTPGYTATSHAMPAYTHLSDADIDAMVYMLAQQR